MPATDRIEIVCRGASAPAISALNFLSFWNGIKTCEVPIGFVRCDQPRYEVIRRPYEISRIRIFERATSIPVAPIQGKPAPRRTRQFSGILIRLPTAAATPTDEISNRASQQT